jgi:hypothetical protein
MMPVCALVVASCSCTKSHLATKVSPSRPEINIGVLEKFVQYTREHVDSSSDPSITRHAVRAIIDACKILHRLGSFYN